MTVPMAPPHQAPAHRRGSGAALLAVAACLVGCADKSPRAQFDDEVAPALERRCLSTVCHGVAEGAEERGEIVDWHRFYVRVDDHGLIVDHDAAYDAARARLNTLELPELSSLLRKPLARSAGGTGHEGGAIFASQADPVYQAFRAWAQVESHGGEGLAREQLDERERLFGETVQPLLASRQCMNEACHGPFAPFTGFRPPAVVGGVRVFSREDTRQNHHTARIHLFLGGDVLQSRLLRKALPLGRGGIAHRGGNAIFFNPQAGASPLDDEGVAAIVRWAESERGAALPGVDAGQSAGVVYIQGRPSGEGPYDHGAFAPGTDLVAGLTSGERKNLTASAHPAGPADVRDPAVRHDGARVAFSMKTSPAGAFDIYEVGLDDTPATRLTEGEPGVSNVQPTYGPDGRIYFVSTRGKRLAEGLRRLDTEIWAVDPKSGALEQMTHDPAPEATPTFFGVGKSYGTLAFSVLRSTPEGPRSVVFRAPLDHNPRHHGDPELHIHHGLTAPSGGLYAMRAMPDGRFVAVMLSPDAPHRAGQLVLLDRQMGPDGSFDASEAAVGGFRHAITVLGEAESPARRYRHPVPMPDGRILVSVAGEDDSAFSLEVLTIEEDASTARPFLASREALPLVAHEAHDAELLVARPLEDDPAHERAFDPRSKTGTLALRHVETLEAIMATLEPRGARPLRGDLAYARLIEALDVTEQDLAGGPFSASFHGPSRILAEVPLRGGSLSVEVPASTPIRVQLLDATMLATGTQHRRWLDVAPGQRFPGGVSPALYPTLCAGCHGSLSGEPGDAAGPVPDMITSASITMATHEGRDPRRPIAPARVGAQGIEVTFIEDVLPLLERSCSSCHREGQARPDLASRGQGPLHGAYASLLADGEGSGHGRRYVDDIGSSARQSALIERVLGRELDAPATVDGACPGEPPLSADEQLTLARWVDLGAIYRRRAR